MIKRHSNEFLLPHKLTDNQHQILLGSLLGDSCLSLTGKSKYPRLSIGRSYKDKEFLYWQYEQYKELCGTPPRDYMVKSKLTMTESRMIGFKTRSVPAFLPYYNQWYLNYEKIIPNNLQLTPLMVSVWFADDGSISMKGNSIAIQLATDGFNKQYTQNLCDLLSTTIKAKVNMYHTGNKDQYFLMMSSRSSIKFIEYIGNSYDQLNMSRKSDVWNKIDFNLYSDRRFDSSENDLSIDQDRLLKMCKDLGSFYLNDLIVKIEQHHKDIGKNNHRTLRRNLSKLIKLGLLTKTGKEVDGNSLYIRNKYTIV